MTPPLALDCSCCLCTYPCSLPAALFTSGIWHINRPTEAVAYLPATNVCCKYDRQTESQRISQKASTSWKQDYRDDVFANTPARVTGAPRYTQTHTHTHHTHTGGIRQAAAPVDQNNKVQYQIPKTGCSSFKLRPAIYVDPLDCNARRCGRNEVLPQNIINN